MPKAIPMAEAKPLATAAAAPQKTESSKLSLFRRYRSMANGKPETEQATPAAAAPEPKAPRAAIPSPAPAPQANVAISVSPTDRHITSHDEDELEIPAFLRRQAN